MLGQVSAWWTKCLIAALLLGACAASTVSPGINCAWESSSDFSNSWVPSGASCYKWIEAEDYWYPAEQSCIASGGHLVSIKDERENTLVGRMTYCKAAWTGLYGVNAHQLRNASQYRWTDGIVSKINKHNFDRLTTPHQPLVTAEDLEWHNNLYHSRNSYVCKAPSSTPSLSHQNDEATGCISGWQRMGDFCYLQPTFTATYIEAGFYCDGRQAHLVSVHSERELRLLSLLDLNQPTCSVELWIGLVKLNPCRLDFSNGRVQQICYRWADRSGDHRDFPAWSAGHPIGDRVTNCIVLKDRSMRSEPCHMRHSFVCKSPAGRATTAPPTVRPPTEVPPTREPPTREPPTQEPPTREPPTREPPTREPPTRDPPTREPPTREPPTREPPTREPPTPEPPTREPPTREPPTRTPTQAPSTRSPTEFPPNPVLAAYNFRRGPWNLAQPGRFHIKDSSGVVLGKDGAILNSTTGIQVDTESSALTRPLSQNKNWTIFYMLKTAMDYDSIILDISGEKEEPSLSLIENPETTDLTLYRPTGYFRDESDRRKGSEEPKSQWSRVAVVFEAGRVYFYRNGVDVSSHKPITSVDSHPDNDKHMMLGRIYGSNLPGYRGVLSCFGVAHTAMTSSELLTAFQHYCDL